MSDENAPSPEALKEAAKARLLEQFERDWAQAQRLASMYPELFKIAPGGQATVQQPSEDPVRRI